MNLEMLILIANYISENYMALIAAFNAILGFFIGLFLLIPGDQPEAFLQKVSDFLAKYSKK